MGVHSNNCCGPHGSALQKAKGTISECTPERERDHMGVHSSKRRGPHESALVSYLFNRIRVYSHVVPFASRSALRYSPFHYLKCSPMWSLISYWMHSHVVRNNFWSALRFGPHHFRKCTPKWSPSPYRILSREKTGTLPKSIAGTAVTGFPNNKTGVSR